MNPVKNNSCTNGKCYVPLLPDGICTLTFKKMGHMMQSMGVVAIAGDGHRLGCADGGGEALRIYSGSRKAEIE